MLALWDDFRLVKAIADRGGLTAAAAHLGINHSTAFRRLATVEAAVGIRLFERLRTGYVATPAGTAMVAAAGRIDEIVSQFERDMAGRSAVPAGILRVTAAAGLVTDLLMPIFAGFRTRHPEIRLDIVVSDDALNLSRRDADVAIRATSEPAPNLFGRRLAGLAWALYGPAGAGACDPRICDWVTLADDMAGGRFTRYVRENGNADRIVMRLDTVSGLREAVEAGIGIGLLPCLAADNRPGLRRLADPEPGFSDGLWLLTHPELRHSGRVRAFMDFAGEALTALRPSLEGRSFDRNAGSDEALSRP